MSWSREGSLALSTEWKGKVGVHRSIEAVPKRRRGRAVYRDLTMANAEPILGILLQCLVATVTVKSDTTVKSETWTQKDAGGDKWFYPCPAKPLVRLSVTLLRRRFGYG